MERSLQECKLCHIPQPLSEFHRAKGYANGHRKDCKTCRAAENAANKAQTAIYNAQYCIDHAEEIAVKKRAYYLANIDKENARTAAWVAANPDKRKATTSRYYQRHREECLARCLAWQAANPEKVRLIAVIAEAAKRARRKNDPHNDLSGPQWLELLAIYEYRCMYCPPNCPECRAKTHALTQDHISPSSKGGPNTATNIVPCCKSCNSKKGDGPVLRPVQPVLFTLAPAKHPRPS